MRTTDFIHLDWFLFFGVLECVDEACPVFFLELGKVRALKLLPAFP